MNDKPTRSFRVMVAFHPARPCARCRRDFVPAKPGKAVCKPCVSEARTAVNQSRWAHRNPDTLRVHP